MRKSIQDRIHSTFHIVTAIAVFALPASADSTHVDTSSFGSVTITTTITNQGSDYLWQYQITNTSFANGINVFDLAIDPSNPTLFDSFSYVQSNGWTKNGVDVGVLGEWDLTGSSGITSGSSLTFSFTTAAMGWTSDANSPLCAAAPVGCAVSNFSSGVSVFFTDPNSGPLIPDPNLAGTLSPPAPVPEPGCLSLLVCSIGLLAGRKVLRVFD